MADPEVKVLHESKVRFALAAMLAAAATMPGVAAAADVVHPADPDGSTFTTGLDGWGPAGPGGCTTFNVWTICNLGVGHEGGELRMTFPQTTESSASMAAQSPAFTVGAAPESAIFSMRQRSPLAEAGVWKTTVNLFDVAAGTRRAILPEPEDRTDADFGAFVERSAPVDGLVPGRTYKLEISASASETFRNALPTMIAYDDVALRVVDPSVSAPPALAALGSTPGIDQATVRSWVNPRGTATTVHHEYGTTTGYGAQTAPVAVGDGTAGVTAERPITGLQPCSTYHFRAVATSAHGTSTGADQTFWTACKPTVEDAGAFSSGSPLWLLNDPQAVSPFGLRLGGRIRPNGLPTTSYFEYGTTTAYGRKVPGAATAGLPRRSPGASAGTGDQLPQLEFGTVYHLRLVATNALGTTIGPDVTFRTGRLPVATPPSPAVLPAKLEVARAQVLRADRRLSVLAPITARAAGRLLGRFQAAGRTTTFAVRIDSARRRVRFSQKIGAAQARLGTGILTLAYGGDADTQPQTVRLRAAVRKANLKVGRPRITGGGRLQASGTISARARGVVRLQVLYEPPTGSTRTLAFKVTIKDGRFRFDQRLPTAVQQQIAVRRGTVHSYVLFTGYLQARMRGEMQSYQILGNR